MRPPPRTTRSTNASGLGSTTIQALPAPVVHVVGSSVLQPIPPSSPSTDKPAAPLNAHVSEVDLGISTAVGDSDLVQVQEIVPALPLVFTAVSNSESSKKPRHRMTDRQSQMLEALFQRNTHPSRQEKESLATDFHVPSLLGERRDLKTITIWFQNKRQTTKKQRDGSVTKASSPALDGMTALASASALMTPLRPIPRPCAPSDLQQSEQAFTAFRRFTLKPYVPPSSGAPPLHAEVSYSQPQDDDSHELVSMAHCYSSLHTSELIPIPVLHSLPLVPTMRSHASGSVMTAPSAPALVHSIQPHDLWKLLPSSPPSCDKPSPDCSPEVQGIQDGPNSNDDTLPGYKRPRSLEWACSQMAKRRRENPEPESPTSPSLMHVYPLRQVQPIPIRPFHNSFGITTKSWASLSSSASPLPVCSTQTTVQGGLVDVSADIIRGAELLLELKWSLGRGRL
ncbi:hypothetical protein EVG20_g2454 [Dentipellis fragilis]|uniref:Homeobox domain-containing protein n=1 Tax=Dentipellis fragilis TaxID=205917 RepID=A0A4Y9Z9P1_9AGAM|nr:hypothetical protein EVG20_g2454 [Dentipellis fragilis]